MPAAPHELRITSAFVLCLGSHNSYLKDFKIGEIRDSVATARKSTRAQAALFG